MEIIKAKLADVNSIVQIHCDAFKGFFLTSLGKPFLKFYYSCFIASDETVVLCAVEDGRILGFSAAAKNSRGFNTRLIKKNFLKFCIMAVKLVITSPKSIVRLARNLRKNGGGNLESNISYAELYSIGVSSLSQGQGIGKKLLSASEKAIKNAGVNQLSLTTDFYNNESALAFYHSMGYETLYEFIAYPDRRMYRLIKKL